MRTSFIIAALASSAFAQIKTLCDQYGYYSSNGFEINNNMWGKDSGSGSQCTYVDYVDSGAISWRTTWNWSGSENNVKAYPYAGRQITKKLVNQYSNLQTSVTWNYDNQNIRCNVAYDLFTAADINHSASSGDYELMVWLGRFGNVYPIGSSQGNVNVAGRTWELFYGLNGNMKVYSFVAPQQINSFSANLKDFFTYLTNSKGFPSNQNLITYQFGTEPFTGSSTLNVKGWQAQAN